MHKYIIYGYGKTGQACRSFLQKKNYPFIVVDKKKFNNKDIFFPDKNINWKDFTTLIKSPGIDYKDDFIQQAYVNKLRVVDEFEFAYEYFKQSLFIAVTGTNGKSTTVTLIYYLLKNKFKNVCLCGNIGKPLTGYRDLEGKKNIFIAELSSYQLERFENFSPYIAILLNFTPDHLQRHRNLKNYYNAKMNICKNMKTGYLLFNSNYFKQIENKEVQKLKFPKDFKFDGKKYTQQAPYKSFSLETILKGRHNFENISFAVKTALIMGVESQSIQSGMKKFLGVEHRIEFVKKINNLEIYNDSKATTYESTYAAVTSFKKDIFLIISGKLKQGMKIQNFLIKLNKYKNVKKIFVLGNIAENDNIKKEKNVICYNGYDWDNSLYKIIMSLKKREGIVLFSPGMPSFDNFNNFEERGIFFKKAVKTIKNK
ncbi:MAG: UDP-N-acetylmuramoyl-L-alanine--D-glutamate ligase [Candidatus Muiribacteriota bacterium]